MSESYGLDVLQEVARRSVDKTLVDVENGEDEEDVAQKVRNFCLPDLTYSYPHFNFISPCSVFI